MMSNSAKETNELSQQLIQQMSQLCDENYSSEVQRILERFGYDVASECQDHVSDECYEKSFEKKFEEMDWKVKYRAIQQLANCGMQFDQQEKEMNEMKEQVRRMEREVREVRERVAIKILELDHNKDNRDPEMPRHEHAGDGLSELFLLIEEVCSERDFTKVETVKVRKQLINVTVQLGKLVREKEGEFNCA